MPSSEAVWKGLHFWPSVLKRDEVLYNAFVAMPESKCTHKKPTNIVLNNKIGDAFNNDSK